jgi:hypothetical protein
MDIMFSEPGEDYLEISKVIFKCFREDNNIIYIGTCEIPFSSQNSIYDPLNVGDRITIAYNGTVKCLLATMAGDCELMLIRVLDSLLEEEYSIINCRDIRATGDGYKDVSL